MSNLPLDRDRRREALSLRQIRYFVTAAETESLSRAAHELLISQSSITEAIKTLEYEVGAKLFVRHAKGVRLTTVVNANQIVVIVCMIVPLLITYRLMNCAPAGGGR